MQLLTTIKVGIICLAERLLFNTNAVKFFITYQDAVGEVHLSWLGADTYKLLD